MDKSNFDKHVKTLHSNHATFKRYLTFMIVSNVILVLALIFSLSREKIVLVPHVATEYKIWLTKSEVSPEYLNTLSRNSLDLLLNLTSDTVSAQFNELMKLVAPKYRAELKSKLDGISTQITQNNLSQNFYIQNIRIINKTNMVYVDGTLNQYIDRNLSKASHQIYKLSFIVHDYNVQIKNIELLTDNDPQLRELQQNG